MKALFEMISIGANLDFTVMQCRELLTSPTFECFFTEIVSKIREKN